MATLQEFENRIYQLNDDFNFLSTKKNPATLEQIQAFQEQFDFILSTQAIDFLRYFGTVIIDISKDIWQRPKEFDVMPAWKFNYGFYVFGLCTDNNVPDWFLYNQNFDTSLNAVVFFEFPHGGMRAYLRKNGDIYMAYDHTSDWQEMDKFEGDFFDFLIVQIEELEQRYQRYINEK